MPIYASMNLYAIPLKACALPNSGQILETKAVLELSWTPLLGGVMAFIGSDIKFKVIYHLLVQPIEKLPSRRLNVLVYESICLWKNLVYR